MACRVGWLCLDPFDRGVSFKGSCKINLITHRFVCDLGSQRQKKRSLPQVFFSGLFKRGFVLAVRGIHLDGQGLPRYCLLLIEWHEAAQINAFATRWR